MPRVDYEAVFRAGATPYAVFTPELVIADVNDTFLAMVGRSREELVGVELFEAFPPDLTTSTGRRDRRAYGRSTRGAALR